MQELGYCSFCCVLRNPWTSHQQQGKASWDPLVPSAWISGSLAATVLVLLQVVFVTTSLSHVVQLTRCRKHGAGFVLFCFFKTGFRCGFGACPGTSSCSLGWSRTHREPPAAASRVLGLKACATTARPNYFLKEYLTVQSLLG